MELVVIALISFLSIIIIGFVIHNSKKSLVEFKDQNNKKLDPTLTGNSSCGATLKYGDMIVYAGSYN